MAKIIGKKLLCSTENYQHHFKSIQGLEGRTLFERYRDMEHLIVKKIAPKYKHFLAEPIKEGDTLDWYSKSFSESPRQLSTLQGAEKEQYLKEKQATIEHFRVVIELLKKDNKSLNDALSLENAIKFVDDEFVYCYDGITVLGVWGMELREEARSSGGIFVKNQYVKNPTPPTSPAPIPPEEIHQEEDSLDDTSDPVNNYTVRFNAGENGTINGATEVNKYENDSIYDEEIPTVEPKDGYEFVGWNERPNGHAVTGDVEFEAQYRAVAPLAVLPWYMRFWNWLRTLFSAGCLRWLLGLLFLLLLFLLLCCLFRRCSGCHGASAGTVLPSPIDDKPSLLDDPRSGGGGIYNPGDPYTPVPTPPDYSDILPPNQGTLPPIDTSKIIREPGNPVIIGNKLNVLMENEDKSIMDLARAFKSKYPADAYKVVYYDDVVKRMQIEVPDAERVKLKEEIPAAFAPEYQLFVFDEALFEQNYNPSDPAFGEVDKSWYLNAINAPKAWDLTKGSDSITIAVVDNGFNLAHPELKDKVVMPYNVWLRSKEISPQSVDHGTHVAGTALAAMDNGKGICGIAPECTFMPIQVANKQGLMTTTSVLDGVLYAIYQGADVVNVSLGIQFAGSVPDDQQQDLQDNHFKEEERLWNEIMRISNKHKTTLVIAAGNENMLAGVGAMNRPKNFVVVSALDKENRKFQKAGFSNFGSYSTVSAPGVGIYSSVGSNDYQFMDGTSMAAPIVSGTIALMKSLNKNLTNEQIICIIKGTGKQSNDDIGNFIQIDKALERVKSGNFNNLDCQPTPSSGEVQILLSWGDHNDLDMACIDPAGDAVWHGNKKVPSGGILEIDMNANGNLSKTPVENIYWPQGGAPDGTYQLLLWMHKQQESAIAETPYKMTVKYGDKTKELTGKIKKQDGKLGIFTFTLGNPTNPQKPDLPSEKSNERKDELEKKRKRLLEELEKIDNELIKEKSNPNLPK